MNLPNLAESKQSYNPIHANQILRLDPSLIYSENLNCNILHLQLDIRRTIPDIELGVKTISRIAAESS